MSYASSQIIVLPQLALMLSFLPFIAAQQQPNGNMHPVMATKVVINIARFLMLLAILSSSASELKVNYRVTLMFSLSSMHLLSHESWFPWTSSLFWRSTTTTHVYAYTMASITKTVKKAIGVHRIVPFPETIGTTTITQRPAMPSYLKYVNITFQDCSSFWPSK